MDATNNESLLRIRTHNVNGFDNSKECLFQECDDDAFDILGVQEHWLRPSFKKEQVAQGQYVVSDTRCPALHDFELE